MPHRRGLSLMEVILAIAILGGSMAVIGQLLHLGSRNAAMARDLTLAQLYCETKVNEILVGTIVPEAISDVELDETSAKGEWLYKIDVLGTETPGVIGVNVTVGQNPNIITRPVSFSISRLMVDPQMVEELAAQDAALKQAFADAKTAAEGPMSGTVAYTANSGGAAAGGAGGGGGGFGGGQGGGDRRRQVSDGQDGGRGRGRDGEDGGQGRGRDGGDEGQRRGRGEGDKGKRPPGPTDERPTDRVRPDRPPNEPPVPDPRQFKKKG